MPLSFPKLALPDVEETIAFRAVDKVLRHDTILKHVVKQYSSWAGTATDLQPPTAATCPYLQIAPKPMTGRWEAESLQRTPFTVIITCATLGTNADQLMNLFGHVRRALWPHDATKLAAVGAILGPANIVTKSLTLGAFGTMPVEKGSSVLVGQGHLELLLHIHVA